MRQFSILLVALFAFFFPCWAENGKLLWSRATDWGHVRVRQQGDFRILLFADEDGETEESRILIKQPHQPQELYLRQMVEATRLTFDSKESPRFLVVGMGAGTLSMSLAHHFPSATITSVELEPAVVEAAKRFFFYRESHSMVTVVDDARHFLETSELRYDAIFLDAFNGVEVPATLRTLEFAQLLQQRLEPDGVVMANIHFVPEQSSQRYRRTLSEVFPCRYLTQGLAQGVGLFSQHPLAVASAPPDDPLLAPAPHQLLPDAEPYRDSDAGHPRGR